ncbi:uncharacterized protein SETTUDRAFT_27017 [Exserohilum turcica Et28A]|uniref:Uncharacterized protein n=1 Tax=Exserohilum turcicum (strain 28A) TaxID=671987 RepID=R0KLZ9_EXST2|nr:uncharacterized protein SETTUDRAFT_27017 [Exserohilum turcica Et28A]EOA88967.1 hypothetical protein SETTUDRAFT_27017 [Exserohilum turcica Et28A]
MKLPAIFLLATSAMTSRLQLPKNNNNAAILINRDLDPATMDPAQFSVLRVLKNAMPSGPNPPFPTGTSDPAWYQSLPQDVKQLLPKFYPVVQAAAVSQGEISSSGGSSSSSTTITSEQSGTSTAVDATTSSASQSSSATTPPSLSPSLTSTTAARNSSSSSTVRTTSRTSATSSAATARPSVPSSNGSRTLVQTPVLAVFVAWIAVATAFSVLG